jgi:vitamin B12 transporter
VFIDGVRVDSQGTGGASWEAIPLSQVDRIEVLRGPAGAVYGSDAMGGVIQIFTRKGEGPASPYVGLGFGTYGTTKAEAGISGSQGIWDYALGLVRQQSKGFNSLRAANPDDDGYTSESLAARVGIELTAAHRLDLSVLSSQLNAQYDNQGGDLTVDDRTVKKLQTSSLSWRAQWSADYSSTLRLTTAQDRYETLPSPDLTVTNSRGYLWQSEYRKLGHLFTWAFERREDALTNSETAPRDTSHFQNALALGYGWAADRHSVQMNLRHDIDSVFGPQTTGALGYGYALSPNWRIKAAAGTAFRAPTLYQRFSPYGAADLLPETSRNLDLGLNYAEGPRAFGLTLYQNNVSNLIQYEGGKGTCPTNVPTDPSYDPEYGGCYANTAKARYQGMTLTGRYLIGNVTVSGSLDLQDPRDSVSGNLLARRAQQHGKLAADTRIQGWAVGAELQASGLRYNDAGNTTELPGYVLLGLHAQTQLAKNWTVLVRLDNLTDAKYELAQGYASAGRSLFAGLSWAR